MDRGYYLRATATYTDPHSAPDDPETMGMDERILTTGIASLAENRDGDNGKRSEVGARPGKRAHLR